MSWWSDRQPAWWPLARQSWRSELLAGVILGVVVTPQSMGYAMLAGLPPVYGLYAAIVPVVIYAFAGASWVQAVGPVAVTAIMTAQALAPLGPLPVPTQIALAGWLALMMGGWLWLAGQLRLGWLTQLISRGVLGGFITGSAALIAASQIGALTGLGIHGDNLLTMLQQLWQKGLHYHGLTVLLGAVCILLLWLLPGMVERLLHWHTGWQHGKQSGQRRPNAGQAIPDRPEQQLPEKKPVGQWLSRLFPLLLVIVMTGLSSLLHWSQQGVAVVGPVATGLPLPALPQWPSAALGFDWQTVIRLLPVAGLMALVAFVSAASVGQFLARERNQPYDSNRELTGLGWANMLGALWQGHPVTGGFSRTAVAVSSGARTPLTGLVAAGVILLMLLALAGWLQAMPLAVLAALIVVAVLRMPDISTLRQAWGVDRAEALAWLATFAGVLAGGLFNGLLLGLVVSLVTLIWRTRQPHLAVLGQVQDAQGRLQPFFRNVLRHQVKTWPALLILRIDENIYFGNVDGLSRHIQSLLAQYPQTRHLVLDLSAVNHIDLSGQHWLADWQQRLTQQDIILHLTDAKGPIMDRMQRNPALSQLLAGHFLDINQAVATLTCQPEPEYFL